MTLGGADKKLDILSAREGVKKMRYTEEQRQVALKLYDETHSVSKVIHRLGYPSKMGMYTWIGIRNRPLWQKGVRKRLINTPKHPLHPPLSLKMDVLHRCFENGENVQLVSEEIGYSRTTIYFWHKKYIQGGAASLMNPNDDRRGKMIPGKSASVKEVQKLKAQMQDMQIEIDILKETLNVLKKDPGVDLTVLKNREKAAIIDAVKAKCRLPILLGKFHMARSSYYYQHALSNRHHVRNGLTGKIKELFIQNKGRYGYRRIHALLKRIGIIVSEKILRQIMKTNGLVVKNKRTRKYSSYKGEITPAVPNILNRNFKADAPNKKWLTDITEFILPDGKVYLSPIVDCFDGMLAAWNISTVPDATLVNKMLGQAIKSLSNGAHPIVHTDRGCHYRWPAWIAMMKQAGLRRSMSSKGCSPDNSACEGFFGRLKNEMFYNRNWIGTSIPQFINILNDYLVWYNKTRIKVSLGNKSPVEYRQSLGISA